jgi:hypothetical protein
MVAIATLNEIMHANTLTHMNFFSAYEIPIKALQAGNTGTIICCLWMVVLVGVIWSLWLESNATSAFWSSTSGIFKSIPVNVDNHIIKDLPIRMPRTVDRRSSSFAKVQIDPSDQV